MRSVAGIFQHRDRAERARRELLAIGIPDDRVSLLIPGRGAAAIEREVEAVPTSDTEQPGMGAAVGGVVGGAVGLSGGAMATVFMPGVGPIVGAGVAAMALFGAMGAVGGAIVGGAVEDALANGLPKDELFVYEDALRQGRCVLVAFADGESQAASARDLLRRTGAEDVDAARERWWLGLRDTVLERYGADGEETDESAYRAGFEAALRADTRGKAYDDATTALAACDPARYRSDSFRRGYDRGHAYAESARGDAEGRDR